MATKEETDKQYRADMRKLQATLKEVIKDARFKQGTKRLRYFEIGLVEGFTIGKGDSYPALAMLLTSGRSLLDFDFSEPAERSVPNDGGSSGRTAEEERRRERLGELHRVAPKV